MNFKKTIIFLFILTIGTANQAYTQGHVTSPYSFIGLGDNFAKGNIRSLSMGGVDMAIRNPMYINMKNPAGLSGIDSMSFVGSVGLAVNNSSYRTSDMTTEFTSGNVNHLAVAFPVTRWWRTAFMLLPYSSMGYQVSDNSTVQNGGRVDFNYKGDGGMDAVNWTNAISITDNLAFGISASYYFGKLEHTKTVNFPDSIYFLNSMVREKIIINGLFFEAGVQYYHDLNEHNTLGFGLNYGNKSVLNSKTDYVAFTYLGNELYNNNTLDTIRVWKGAESSITLPFSIGAGISWEKKNRILLAADFRFEKWEDFKYMDHNLELTNKIQLAVGGEYIPVSNNLSAYWKMVHYRMGFRYETLGMKFADTELKEYAVSVGFGLPLKRSSTILNLGFELGQNGTISNNLIQERYFRVMLGVSIKETWFRKSKYY